jgi:hypothetical protein
MQTTWHQFKIEPGCIVSHSMNAPVMVALDGETDPLEVGAGADGQRSSV